MTENERAVRRKCFGYEVVSGRRLFYAHYKYCLVSEVTNLENNPSLNRSLDPKQGLWDMRKPAFAIVVTEELSLCLEPRDSHKPFVVVVNAQTLSKKRTRK